MTSSWSRSPGGSLGAPVRPGTAAPIGPQRQGVLLLPHGSWWRVSRSHLRENWCSCCGGGPASGACSPREGHGKGGWWRSRCSGYTFGHSGIGASRVLRVAASLSFTPARRRAKNTERAMEMANRRHVSGLLAVLLAAPVSGLAAQDPGYRVGIVSESGDIVTWIKPGNGTLGAGQGHPGRDHARRHRWPAQPRRLAGQPVLLHLDRPRDALRDAVEDGRHERHAGRAGAARDVPDDDRDHPRWGAGVCRQLATSTATTRGPTWSRSCIPRRCPRSPTCRPATCRTG